MHHKPVKALVLTFDRYRCFTDHMIRCYERLWPDHPFIFHIPCQEVPESDPSGRVRYIKSNPGIQETLHSLLLGLDDEDLVYWCIDDKYPIKLNTRRIMEIHDQLLSGSLEDTSGILFCRCRGMLSSENLTGSSIRDGAGNSLLERSNYSQIWIHQYVKVKVLRFLFNSFPGSIPSAKAMDTLKQQVSKPAHHRLFVTRKNLAIFGESTSRGAITQNCLNSMKAQQLELPPWVTATATRKQIIMGDRKRDMVYHYLRDKVKAMIDAF